MTESRHATVTGVGATGEDAPGAAHSLTVEIEARGLVVEHLMLHDAGPTADRIVRLPHVVAAPAGSLDVPSASPITHRRFAAHRARVARAREAFDVLQEGGCDPHVADSALTGHFYAVATVCLSSVELGALLRTMHPFYPRTTPPTVALRELLAAWRAAFPEHVAGWESAPVPESTCRHPRVRN